MRNTPSNRDDIIDSRDIIERIKELEDEREGLTDDVSAIETELEEADDNADQNEIKERLDAAREAVTEWDNDYADELKALKALEEEAEGYAPDWRHGCTLIADSYFETYAEELASEISDYNPSKVSWPFTCIDWEKAARELQMDYTSVDFDGETYWVR